MINGYDIKNEDFFDELKHPLIVGEIAGLHRALIKTRNLYKTDIVISFLKTHSLKGEWLKGNNEAARVMSSGSVAISNLESIFVACKSNQQFCDGLESYIKREFENWDVRLKDTRPAPGKV